MYPTDLEETQCQVIKKILNMQERKRKYDLRATAFSFKNNISSLFFLKKSLKFAHSDAEALPNVFLFIVHFNIFCRRTSIEM